MTREQQYQPAIDYSKEHVTVLGPNQNYSWRYDPRHIGFVFSRYKFVSKMFSGLDRVLEVGCGDAFWSRIVIQEVGRLTATDFDPIWIENVRSRMGAGLEFDCELHDMTLAPHGLLFDAAYAIDVLEHIANESEWHFLRHIAESLKEHGSLIIGTPSKESQAYASEHSRIGHINCKTAKELRETLGQHFRNVFMFSMNDEVVHTGYSPMAHYLIALCCGKRL